MSSELSRSGQPSVAGETFFSSLLCTELQTKFTLNMQWTWLEYPWCQQHSYGTDKYWEIFSIPECQRVEQSAAVPQGDQLSSYVHDCTNHRYLAYVLLQLLDLLLITSAKCWDRPSYKVSYKFGRGIGNLPMPKVCDSEKCSLATYLSLVVQ